MLPGLSYWFAICIMLGLGIYAILCRCDPLGDPRHDAGDNDLGGDRPHLPGDLKSVSHSTTDTTGEQYRGA